MTVSKAEPTVSIAATPLAVGVHLYQTDVCVPLTFQWIGSPLSPVALAFVPVTMPLRPAINWALAKLSFGGGRTTVTFVDALTVFVPFETSTVYFAESAACALLKLNEEP